MSSHCGLCSTPSRNAACDLCKAIDHSKNCDALMMVQVPEVAGTKEMLFTTADV